MQTGFCFNGNILVMNKERSGELSFFPIFGKQSVLLFQFNSRWHSVPVPIILTSLPEKEMHTVTSILILNQRMKIASEQGLE